METMYKIMKIFNFHGIIFFIKEKSIYEDNIAYYIFIYF